MSEKTPIVIDNGSGSFKFGFSGTDEPQVIYPKELPMEHGVVTNWDQMELVWKQIYEKELKVNAKEHPVLLTDAPLNPRMNREEMAQIMFEHFEIPALYVASTSLLSLYANGRFTGAVLECGAGVTSTSVISDGYTVAQTTNRFNFAGIELTNFLKEMLQNNEYLHKFSAADIIKISRDIKEKLAYVSLCFDGDMAAAPTSISHKLPDGNSIKLDQELFRCAEALFQPQLYGQKSRGVHEMMEKSILKSDEKMHKNLYTNIVLSGGSTMFPGFAERFDKEMTALISGTKIKVIAMQDRKYGAWLGGSMMSGLPTFKEVWINKKEYDEDGNSIFDRKCVGE